MKITINTHKDSNSFEHLIHGKKIRINFLFEGELFVYVKYRQLSNNIIILLINYISKTFFNLCKKIFFITELKKNESESSLKIEDKYKTIRKLKFNRGHINTVANFYYPEIQFISVGLFSYNIKNTKLNIELINLINNKVEPKPANIDFNINTKKIAQKLPAGILNVTKQALFKFQKNTIRLPNGKFLLKPTQSKLVIKNNIIETEQTN